MKLAVADDIVTRLRSENRMVLAPLHMSDAADEIERLRAELADLHSIRVLHLCPDCYGTGSQPIPGDDGYPRRCYHHRAPTLIDVTRKTIQQHHT